MRRQTIRRHVGRLLLIPVSALSMNACSYSAGVTESGADVYEVDIRFENVYSAECTVQGCVPKPIQPFVVGALLDPQGVVEPGASRVFTGLRTFVGDTLFVKACRTDGTMGCDQHRCRVQTPEPTVFGKAEFRVVFDLRDLNHTITCSEGWENF